MKKTAITSLLAVLLLIFGASSAFAATAMEPDSASNPNKFYGEGDWFYGTLPDFSDIDYYSYTNNTGGVKYFYLYLENVDDPSLDYRIWSIGVSGWPPGSTSIYFDQVGRKCWSVVVPAGGELRVSVRASNTAMVHPTSKYLIMLNDVPPAP